MISAVMTNTDPPFPEYFSPLYQLRSDTPALCIGCAENDVSVPKEESFALYKRALELGLDAMLMLWKDMPHGAAEAHHNAVWPPDCGWWEAIVEGLEFVLDRLTKDD